MTFLKNKTAWKKWVKKQSVEDAPEPKFFPCYAYDEVISWYFQTTRANYLYYGDLVGMMAKFMTKP